MTLAPHQVHPAPDRSASPAASGGDLVTRARRGDRAAADELARSYVQPAYVLALQLLGHPEDARDAAQDALMRFFARLDRIDPERPIRPWLFAIVRNAARDLGRRRAVRRSDSLDLAREEFGADVIDEAADPEADSRRGELRRDVWRALGRLTDKEREILVLRDYQDLSYAEIAQILAIPVGTVMSRLHRARRALRGLLAAEYGPPGLAAAAERAEAGVHGDVEGGGDRG